MTWPARCFTFSGEYNVFLKTADVALGGTIDGPYPQQIPSGFSNHDDVSVSTYRGATGGFAVIRDVAEDNSPLQRIIAYAVPGVFS